MSIMINYPNVVPEDYIIIATPTPTFIPETTETIEPTETKFSSEPTVVISNEPASEAPICPISQSVISELWISKCGHAFEKNEIFRWLKTEESCPVCRKFLGSYSDQTEYESTFLLCGMYKMNKIRTIIYFLVMIIIMLLISFSCFAYYINKINLTTFVIIVCPLIIMLFLQILYVGIFLRYKYEEFTPYIIFLVIGSLNCYIIYFFAMSIINKNTAYLSNEMPYILAAVWFWGNIICIVVACKCFM